MTMLDEDREKEPEQAFGDWLRAELLKQGMSQRGLANRTGLSEVAISHIVRGHTQFPQARTRQAIYSALQAERPAAVEEIIEAENKVSGYVWTDFSPYDLDTVPEEGGIYVFYDITDRPVYVGKSGANVRVRVKDHQTRFWFKEPLVTRGSFLAVPDVDMCAKIELILIKFLGNHALLNSKGVVRDLEGGAPPQ